MPFMLKPCGHALRFSTPDGVCRRCKMDVDGTSNTSHESLDAEMRMNAENVEPAVLQELEETKKPFLEQVEKLVAVMVNSEGPEINEAVAHVARNMSTFTAGERSDFVRELVIMFCEARREDQPRIDTLLKELVKKNVLAKTHFLQSAKRLVAETATLVVDWPNIYDCTVELIGTNLSLLKNSADSLEAFAKLLNHAPAEQAQKYLTQIRRRFPSVSIPDSKSDHPDDSPSSAQPRSAVGFFLSPTGAKDKFIRPVGMRSPSPPRNKPAGPRYSYSRVEMLKIEANCRHFALPDGLLAMVKMTKNDSWVLGDRDNQLGKRPRFVSESGAYGDPAGSSKRMLESTSPPLMLSIPLMRMGVDAKSRFDKPQGSLGSSPPAAGSSLTGFDRPRFQSDGMDAMQVELHRNGPAFPVSPKKTFHEGSNSAYHYESGGSKPRFATLGSSVLSKTDQPPIRHVAAKILTVGEKAPPAGPNQSRPGVPKTKKFLTALKVERMTEMESSQLSPTLSPNVKTWSRGSGSLNAFTLRPGLSGTSSLKDGVNAAPLLAPRSFGMNHHNNGQRGSLGDQQRAPPYRMSPGVQGPKTDQQPDSNWRRGLSQA